MKQLLKLLSKLPLAVLYLLSDMTYYLLYYGVRYRRDIVRSNLSHAFPEKPEAEIIALEKKYYRFLCDNMSEAIASQSMSQEQIVSRFNFTNPELIQPYLDKQQSLQLLTIHQGCWEWIIQILPIKLNVPVDAIYKTLHDSDADEFFLENRSRFGSNLVPAEKAMKMIIRKRREFRIFTMMADQPPIRKEKKYWSNFFNRPAPFYLGTQKIAELTQYPVIYLTIHRTKRGYYDATFEVMAEPPFEKNSYDVVEGYVRAAERAIRAQPETWLWSNRKWKRAPEGDENDIFAADVLPEVTSKNPPS